MTPSERLTRLYDLAEQDDIYLVWKHSYEEWNTLLQELVKVQPQFAQLLAYAETGRMMAQRVALVACEAMQFPDEDPCEIAN